MKVVSKEWLYEEYVINGRSCESIGKILGISRQAVSRKLISRGIPRRPRWFATFYKPKQLKLNLKPVKEKKERIYKLFDFKKRSRHRRGPLSIIRHRLIQMKPWRDAKKRIIARDKFCRLCCNPENKCDIHHIIPFKDAPLLWAVDTNLILICKRCHWN